MILSKHIPTEYRKDEIQDKQYKHRYLIISEMKI